MTANAVTLPSPSPDDDRRKRGLDALQDFLRRNPTRGKKPQPTKDEIHRQAWRRKIRKPRQ